MRYQIVVTERPRTMHGGAGHWYAGNPAGSGPSVRVGSTQVVVALALAGRLERRGQYYYVAEVK